MATIMRGIWLKKMSGLSFTFKRLTVWLKLNTRGICVFLCGSGVQLIALTLQRLEFNSHCDLNQVHFKNE